MKSFILCFLMIVCLASPPFAEADITLWLTVSTVSSTERDVNLFARATPPPDLTQIDGVQWGIAYDKDANTASTTLIYDFASDWTPLISLFPTSIGSYDEMIFWFSFGSDKTISSAAGGTLLATVRFTKVGADWGTVHIVAEGEDAEYWTIITNNTVEQNLSYPPEDVSLPVQMTEMKATASAKEGIVLTWTTESEVNNAGYYVWRSETENGKYQRLSTVLISGQGNSSSKTGYSFSDPNATAGKTYWYKIEAVSTDGRSEFHGPISVSSQELIPHEFALTQNYPNPFNPVTEAGFDLPEASNVLIRVFSMLGKEVKTLVDQPKQAGRYSVSWDGTDNNGILAPSGIYFLQMQASSFSYVRKMTFIR
jgi:hypothetical protein